MKKQVADRWVDNLLSGRFRQARDAFLVTKEDGTRTHCCLAVLSELAAKEGVCRIDGTAIYCPPCIEGHPPTQHDERCKFIFDAPEKDWEEYEEGDLPWSVVQWAGLTTPNPFLGPEGDTIHAIQANDEERKSFEEIAALIKQMPTDD